MNVRRMLTIVVCTCLITVCSWLTVPFTVPFTMQTFAVFFVISLLGGRDAFISLVLYVLLGALGLPVFAGFQGGIGHLLSPTGGYISGFFLAALSYIPFERAKGEMRYAGLLTGLFICYITGTMWFLAVSSGSGTSYGFLSVLMICVVPYIIPDLVKLVLAVRLSDRVGRFIDISCEMEKRHG